MANTLVVDQDYSIFDALEAVTLTSVANAGNQSYAVTSVLRRQLTNKELAASNGVYTGQDLLWSVPKALLSVVPKPGDLVTPADGTVYTVLEVDTATLKSRYRLISRNLVLAFQLYDVITIETPVIDQDAAGGKLKTWGPKYLNIPARVQMLTEEISDERLLRGFKGKFAIIVGRQVDVTNEDRVNFGGQYYEIVGYHNPARIDELPVLDCELLP